jgi:hypothetical protein
MGAKMTMFKYVPIFEKTSDGSVRIIQCFCSLEEEKYYIQSIDYIYDNQNREKYYMESINRVIELFIDISPSERIDGYDTILEAIKAFND